jgi:acyl-CoA synthetase (NDP forming)
VSDDRSPAPSKSSSHRLAALFEPESIVLIGATERSFWSRILSRNFNELGYEGRLFAVNRSGNDVFGIKGYASVSEIGEEIDVAFLMVPQAATLDTLDEIGRAGVRYAVVLSAGYAETGAEGAILQEELVARAEALGITLWGPNSLGYINIGRNAPVAAIPISKSTLPPSIAIVTQSGASAVELNDFAQTQNIGASFLAATGNEGMVGVSDIVDYLVDHEATRAIAIFAEEIRDAAAFAQATERARAARKPIVIFKIGRTELSGRVARSHTGSEIGDDAAFSAMCERLGVVRVYSADDLIATAGLMAAVGPMASPGLCFISASGGACTIVADAGEAAGVHLPRFSEATVAGLSEVLPSYGATYNPLDVTGALLTQPDLYEKVVPIAAASPEIGLLAVNIIVPQMDGQGLPPAMPPLGRALTALDKPSIIATTTSRALNQYSRDFLAEHSLPHVVCGLDSMLRAVAKLAWWSEWIGAK